MSRAAVPAAVVLALGGPPASVDFGSIELGGAAHQTLPVPALGVSAGGAGFSATRTPRGVLVVFEPYEPGEEATGVLVLRLRSGRLVRVALHGRGIDTKPPSVTVATPQAVRAGRPLVVRFAATDNDLVRTCTLAVDGRVVARTAWPAARFRWRVPLRLRGTVRLTITAVDRAGNRASASTRPVPVSTG
jgi:hypothetical protein